MTSAPESWRTRLERLWFNWFPAYRRTGGRIRYIAGDHSEVRVELRLTRRTRNYVGTLFGGSMYGAIDPVYMLMLIRMLGPDYVVWDKQATIRFRRPGRETLYAVFRISPDELAAIKTTVAQAGKASPELTVELVNAAGEVHASCLKTLSVRRRA